MESIERDQALRPSTTRAKKPGLWLGPRPGRRLPLMDLLNVTNGAIDIAPTHCFIATPSNLTNRGNHVYAD